MGDPKFRHREGASDQLERVGEAALPQLRAAEARSPDFEIRERAAGVAQNILIGLRASRSTGMPMALGRAGRAAHGSGYGDSPRHAVTLARPFLIGAREVTQAEYKKVMDAAPSHFAKGSDGEKKLPGPDTADFPVERVTWFDAVLFCNALSELDGYPPYYEIADVKSEALPNNLPGKTVRSATVTRRGGRGYRLPTEAEWERACRAGTATAYFYGDRNTGKEANLTWGVGGGYASEPEWKSLGRTSRAGSYPANAWGLSDTHGNVAEWCDDWSAPIPSPETPKTDPRGPRDGKQRVVRGGSWLEKEGSAASGARFAVAPGSSDYATGFRVARTPDGEPPP
jgi:formylglycine-generating enzyme required for sulfatase activity